MQSLTFFVNGMFEKLDKTEDIFKILGGQLKRFDSLGTVCSQNDGHIKIPNITCLSDNAWCPCEP